ANGIRTSLSTGPELSLRWWVPTSAASWTPPLTRSRHTGVVWAYCLLRRSMAATGWSGPWNVHSITRHTTTRSSAGSCSRGSSRYTLKTRRPHRCPNTIISGGHRPTNSQNHVFIHPLIHTNYEHSRFKSNVPNETGRHAAQLPGDAGNPPAPGADP